MVRKNQFAKNKPPHDAATGRIPPCRVREPSLLSGGKDSKEKVTHPPQTGGCQETLEKQLLVEVVAEQNPSVKKCTRKCTARSDRDRDEGSGMEASEWSLGNEGLRTGSLE